MLLSQDWPELPLEEPDPLLPLLGGGLLGWPPLGWPLLLPLGGGLLGWPPLGWPLLLPLGGGLLG